MGAIFGEFVSAGRADADRQMFFSPNASIWGPIGELQEKTDPPEAPVTRASRPRMSFADIA